MDCGRLIYELGVIENEPGAVVGELDTDKIVVELGDSDVDTVPAGLRVINGISELEQVGDAVGDPLRDIELVEDGEKTNDGGSETVGVEDMAEDEALDVGEAVGLAELLSERKSARVGVALGV